MNETKKSSRLHFSRIRLTGNWPLITDNWFS
jgi:hypothetical protein